MTQRLCTTECGDRDDSRSLSSLIPVQQAKPLLALIVAGLLVFGLGAIVFWRGAIS